MISSKLITEDVFEFPNGKILWNRNIHVHSAIFRITIIYWAIMNVMIECKVFCVHCWDNTDITTFFQIIYSKFLTQKWYQGSTEQFEILKISVAIKLGPRSPRLGLTDSGPWKPRRQRGNPLYNFYGLITSWQTCEN